MLKRICVVVFAVLAFAAPLSAHHSTPTYPGWVDAAWESGKRCKRWEQMLRKHGLPVKPFRTLRGVNRVAIRKRGIDMIRHQVHTACGRSTGRGSR